MKTEVTRFIIFSLVLRASYANEEVLASPRFLILGPSGAGKSTLGNALARCPPDSEDPCPFLVCDDLKPCTLETKMVQETFVDTGKNFDLSNNDKFLTFCLSCLSIILSLHLNV